VSDDAVKPEGAGDAAKPAAAGGTGSAPNAARRKAPSAAESGATSAGGDAGDAIAATPGDASLLALIDRLTTLLERSELVELEVEAGETGLVLRKPGAIQTMVPPSPPLVAGPPGGPAAMGPGPGRAAPSGGETTPAVRPAVRAPLTGIYYSAPAPGSAPYVRVGGEVAIGQVIGLIEAMKLFNEIKSDLAGRVVRVVAENGQLVKARQPLIEVEPL
jgi:acetyl-CoA carboxylase biotin carboxyl carrier protein